MHNEYGLDRCKTLAKSPAPPQELLVLNKGTFGSRGSGTGQEEILILWKSRREQVGPCQEHLPSPALLSGAESGDRMGSSGMPERWRGISTRDAEPGREMETHHPPKAGGWGVPRCEGLLQAKHAGGWLCRALFPSLGELATTEARLGTRARTCS